MRSIVLLIILGSFISHTGFSQGGKSSTGTIKGVIVDAKTQEPLSYVNIMVEGPGLGAVSELDGRFSIPDVPAGTYNIVISFVGYSQRRLDSLKVAQGQTLDLGSIELSESAITLREVTVTPGSFSVMGTSPLSRQTLTERELKNMTWAEDITRAVARLPGVSSNDFSSKFTVRGGESDEVLMILDGMELYEPFHQRDFAGGLFSIVDIETIQGVDLLTGGFTAEYGNRQSGVFNMKTKQITGPRPTTTLGLSIMNARIYTDGLFAKGKGSYLFTARKGLLDQVLKIIGSTESLPSFFDMMGKVEYNLGPKNVLSFYGIHAGDKTKIRDVKPDNYDRHDTRYKNSYAWLTLKSTYSDKLYSRTLLFSGFISHNRRGLFHKEDYTDKGDFDLSDKRKYNFFGLKQEWSWDVSDRFYLKAGFDVRQLNADYDYSFSIDEIRVNSQAKLFNYKDSFDIAVKPSGQQTFAYLSGRFMVLPRLFLETGIRHDYASYTGDNLWSPRVSLAYMFGKNTFLRGAWGYYYQTQFINNLDVNHNGDAFNPAELSKHYVLGFEHLFQRGISLRVEAYYKGISRISPVYQNLRDPWEVYPESRNDVVKLDINGAEAKGIELFMKYDVGGKISWWASYALAQAKDNIENIEFEGLLEARTGKFPRLNNQYHTVYLDMNYRPNSKWHFSLSWQYYVGWPRTTYVYESQALPDGRLHFYQRHLEFNGVQYPAYHRMDLRINRHFLLKNGRVSVFAHIINLYNRENLKKFDLDVTNDDGNLTPDGNGGYLYGDDSKNWFGLTPVIGASWEF